MILLYNFQVKSNVHAASVTNQVSAWVLMFKSLI